MGQASVDKSPTGINCHKTEGRDECLSGTGKSRNKDSEVRMKTGYSRTRKWTCLCRSGCWQELAVGSPLIRETGAQLHWLWKLWVECGPDMEVTESPWRFLSREVTEGKLSLAAVGRTSWRKEQWQAGRLSWLSGFINLNQVPDNKPRKPFPSWWCSSWEYQRSRDIGPWTWELIKGLPISHPSLRKQANLVSLEVGAQ